MRPDQKLASHTIRTLVEGLRCTVRHTSARLNPEAAHGLNSSSIAAATAAVHGFNHWCRMFRALPPRYTPVRLASGAVACSVTLPQAGQSSCAAANSEPA